MSQTNVYQENGYLNRNQYLEELAEDYDLPVRKVKKLANMLGPEEDFDMLVSMVEELADEEYYYS
jgi:hypothetical protein